VWNESVTFPCTTDSPAYKQDTHTHTHTQTQTQTPPVSLHASNVSEINCTTTKCGGPGIVVDMAPGYGLDGPGIESWRGGEIFRTCSDRPCGPPSLLYNGYCVFPGGKKRPGRDADPLLTSSAVGHERGELYFYSPYGPYGLYRASVPVQRCTLPFTFTAKCSKVKTAFIRNKFNNSVNSLD
jgi:hypothetical protein